MKVFFGIFVILFLFGCSTPPKKPVYTSYSFSSTNTSCVSGDCMNGYGKYVTKSGHYYTGNFMNFRPHGEGTYYFPLENNAYSGIWNQGNLNGECRVSYGGKPFSPGICTDDNDFIRFKSHDSVKRDNSKQKIQKLLKSIESL